MLRQIQEALHLILNSGQAAIPELPFCYIDADLAQRALHSIDGGLVEQHPVLLRKARPFLLVHCIQPGGQQSAEGI